MSEKFKEKITMRFNISQLERTLVALINNGFNKKFAGNVIRLFNLFIEESYKKEYNKELLVYLIKKIAMIITEKDITSKDSILSFLDISGKYEADATELLNRLFELEISPSEVQMLDKLISQQLKFSIVWKESMPLSEMFTNLQTENYEDFDSFMEQFHTSIDDINRDLRSARESIEDSKKDISLGSDNFINLLDKIIKSDRNPAAKVKTGIQYINEAFNGGYEKGQV